MADNYTYDMQRLQQDAIRRAREMQARAQVAAPAVNRGTPRPPAPSIPAAPVSPPAAHQNRSAHTPEQRAPAPQQHEHEPGPGPLGPVKDIFDILMSDSERTLILVLILLLTDEKADMGLIFALMYLII